MTPARPLGPIGTALWDEAAGAGLPVTEELLIVCETADERTALRQRVLRDPTPEDRKALRELDDAVRHGRFVLGLHVPAAPIAAQLEEAIGEIAPVVRRRPLAAIARALAVGLEEATARGDPHGQAAIARELRSVYHELAGPLTDDPFDAFLDRLSTPLGDAAAS
jgi:hypothetical protein